MKFTSASVIENVVWALRLGDYERSENRSRINDLMDGFPPYTDETVRENKFQTNVNFLEGTQLAHDARRQYANAFMKPGNYFKVTLDSGPPHKKQEWSRTITREINKRMKRSLRYMEVLRSTFASLVLHGIGPVMWRDRERWCPDALAIGDVMLPSQTLVSMENLSFFAVFRPYTAEQLYSMTHGPKVDPAWNMPLVDRAIKWADEQGLSSLPTRDTYSPENLQQRLKADLGFYAADAVPTIDCWDFYFHDDEDKESGWNRRIVLDGIWGNGIGGIPATIPDTTILGTKGEFLYNPGKRKYADERSEIIHFQFGDLSAVAPFRYHSVRSLGFMLYAICHLQNRTRCRFSDAVWQHMLQFFRVRNMDDADRALKINLINMGLIEEGVEFIGQKDRWQIDRGLVESALSHYRELMGSNSSSYTQDYDYGREQTEKTATEVTAEMNASTALVGAMLQQAYAYAVFQYREIARRFCKANSIDQDVRRFRLAVLKEGVPEEFLNEDRWEIEAERVLGSGNKMLEVQIAERMMAARNLYDPDAQRDILRDYTLALTDDPGRTERLVPEQPVKVTDSVHDAQLSVGPLMQGFPVSLKTGINHQEYVETLLQSMAMVIQRIEQRSGMGPEQGGGMAKPEEVVGLQNMAQHIVQHIQIIAQDEKEKERVKQYGDQLSKMMNMVRAYMQRIAEAQSQAGNGSPAGPDPETLAKIQGNMLMAQAKAQNTRQSHAEKTAQRRVSFDQKVQQDAEQHAADLRKKELEAQADVAIKALQAEAQAANGKEQE